MQEEIIVFVPACMLKPCINVAEKLTARHREENMNITITVKTETKTHTFTVRLSQCKPALAFAEFLRSGDCTVKMHDDGSCWSGTLAASLFGIDVQESSEPKGICLEQDELCLEEPFVLSDGTKAANWTLIGKLQGVAQDKVRAIIGSGDVTAIFSVK